MFSCEEKIYSEDTFSILLDFDPADGAVWDVVQGICSMKVNNELWAVTLDRRDFAPLSMTDYTYRFLPKLYAPMQTVSFPLLKSGILQVQQPPLALTGRNVLIGIADSGERVIIMPD